MKRTRWRIFWLVYVVLFAGTMAAVNLRLAWLESKIVPFQMPIDLSQPNEQIDVQLPRFATDSYTCMIAFRKFPRPQEARWTEQPSTLPGIDLNITIRDARDETVFNAATSTSTWTQTDHSQVYGDTGIAVFPSAKRFGASAFRSYTLEVQVISGNPNAAECQPVLYFYGVDDGYFFLRRLSNNIVTIAIFSLIAIVAGITHLVVFLRKRSRAYKRCCRECNYDLRGITSDRCPECGALTLPKKNRDESDSSRSVTL